MKVRVVCHIDRIVDVNKGENIMDKVLPMTPPENYYWEPCDNPEVMKKIDQTRTQRDEIDYPYI